ncbi:Uncharacterised protein [Vibrio cholerae]|nr:Uncharacterised protein [Vibrio cholerae]
MIRMVVAQSRHRFHSFRESQNGANFNHIDVTGDITRYGHGIG